MLATKFHTHTEQWAILTPASNAVLASSNTMAYM